MDWEKEFYNFLMTLICHQGGTRLQMACSDIILEMQKLPPKNPVNMHRKQYGNLPQCLKAYKHPFFTFNDNLVKLLPKIQLDQLNNQGIVPQYELYCKTYQEVQIKLIDVMRINKQNECARCGEIYRILINREGLCGDDSEKLAHIPKHNHQ